jgi:GTPase SAR1 family protein
MSEFNLGPNGAQIVGADLILENTEFIENALKELDDYYVIFDTPGQIELFSFRPGSPLLVDKLSHGKAMVAFVTDAVLSSSPSGFISQKMLYGSVMSRFFKPMLFVLNKTDLITEEDLKNIRSWEEFPDQLYDAFLDEKQEMVKDYFSSVLNAFQESRMISKLLSVSAKDFSGFEDIYSEMSLFFTGGSDADTMYRDD